MKRKTRQNLILVLASICISFLAIEWFLWNVDPYGFRLYINDLGTLNSTLATGHETGIQYLEGKHQLGGYSFTSLPDGLRLVPDTQPSDCKITAIGDSLTFGMGVEDNETWVNVLAIKYPKVEFVNAGRPGYSAGNVLASYEYYESDAFIYIIVDNDGDPMVVFDPEKEPASGQSAISLYIYFFSKQSGSAPSTNGEPAPIVPVFNQDIAELIAKDDVLVVGVETDPLANHDSVFLIPGWGPYISQGDPHPNPQGHQNVANYIDEPVAELIERICGSEYLEEPTQENEPSN